MIRKGQSHGPGISTGSAADLFYSLAVCPSRDKGNFIQTDSLIAIEPPWAHTNPFPPWPRAAIPAAVARRQESARLT